MRRPYLEMLSSKMDDFDNQPETYVHPPLTVEELLIIEAIEELVPDDRELIYMRYYDRMSFRQITKEKGYKTHGTAQYRVNRAARSIGAYVDAKLGTDSSTI